MTEKSQTRNSMLTFSPYDERSSTWNFADFLTDPRSALELVHILLPERQENQTFFGEAARSLLSGLVEEFILAQDID